MSDLATTLARGLGAGVMSLGILAFVFVPLERSFPARAGQPIRRPGLVVDGLFFFGQYVIWNAVSFAVMSSVEGFVHARAALGLRAFVATTPVWMQALAAVVLGDLCVYWFHRACHAWGPLWRFHAVHHTSEHLDWVAAHREHPVDGVCTALAANLPAFVMGFHIDAIAALITFRALWAIFIHSNTRLPLGPLRVLLGAPELHHWHHALLRDDRTTHNFANLAPWLDVLFGTYHRPDPREAETYALGISDPMPRGYAAQLVVPFARLLAPLARLGPLTWRGSRRRAASTVTPRPSLRP